MLRILDANLNRIGEGLRVLEDVSRFILNDSELSEKLKDLRHNLIPGDRSLQHKLLGARQAANDVGAFLDVDSEGERPDTVSLVSANSRRIQQSLRVLEEISKLPEQDFDLDWERFKQARFAIYEMEQTITSKLIRRHKVERICGVYLILDMQALGERNGIEVARQALEGGVRIIQLRDKMRAKGDLISVAANLRKVCTEHDALFIVNDHLDIALACEADGLHIGQDDLPLTIARRLMPSDRLIGCSTATLDEAVHAGDQGADYIAVGSIYPTPSKPGTKLSGAETLRRVKKQVSVPVVAIGGINEDNIDEVIRAGADAVAVISAVLGADNVKKASERLAKKMENRPE